jgi:hypothetical protein
VAFKKPTRDRHKLLVPAVVAGLLAPNQEDCRAERIECVKRPQRPPRAPVRNSRIRG